MAKANNPDWHVMRFGQACPEVRWSGRLTQLAAEAADNGLLAPELAAGIARVKSAKTVGIRMGNWLSLKLWGRRLYHDHYEPRAGSAHSAEKLPASTRRAA